MAYLPYITDKKLVSAVERVINVILKAERDSHSKMYSNVIDPFSALFDGVTHGLSFDEWLKSEKVRQIQKTMQNAIGEFHQDILGNVQGSCDLGTGQGLDVYHEKKRIIAEIKNKYNTTKGNHKVEVYDAIKNKLKESKFTSCVGYYVEIIPQNKRVYNKPFTPPDNKNQKRRPINNRIRVIDGKSFYAMLTGHESALRDLFDVLPRVISDNTKHAKLGKKDAEKYAALYTQAFS